MCERVGRCDLAVQIIPSKSIVHPRATECCSNKSTPHSNQCKKNEVDFIENIIVLVVMSAHVYTE